MLSLMAAATQELTLTSYRIEHRAWTQAHAEAVLDAGVARAVLGIGAADLSDRWRVDGVARKFKFDDATLDISIQDEHGRFDLNVIDVSILSALLRSAGLATDQIDTLADRILDWRSPSDLHRLHGATDDDYTAAGRTYRQRHGTFQTVDELKLVLGMTPEIFSRIRPALTVYTRQPMIDQAVAPREALLALYANDAQKVDAVIAARSGNGTPMEGVNVASLPGVIDPTVPLAGRAFAITAATYIDGRKFVRTAIVEFTDDDQRPYLTMAWQ